MKITIITMLLFLFFGSISELYGHDIDSSDGYRPHGQYLECKKENSEKECMAQFPVTFRQVIPGKYLSVSVGSETELCFDISKLKKKQKKVSLESIIGKTGVYMFGSDDLSFDELKEKRRVLEIHIHRSDTTKLCADGSGFLVNVGSDFIDIWNNADERDRDPFFGRDIWVSYNRGDWKEPYQFWK